MCFMVIQDGAWCVQDTIACSADLQAEIDIIECDRKPALIETSGCPEHVRARQQAGTSYSCNIPDHVCKIIICCRRLDALEAVCTAVKDSKCHTRMLKSAIRIQQFCTDGAN